MRSFLPWALGLKTLVEWSGRIVSSLCLATLFVALLMNVCLRYLFNSGLTWAYELHALLLPWLVAGGILIAAAKGRNIAITLLPEMLSMSAQRYMLFAVEIAAIVIAVNVLWSSTPILRAAEYQSYSTLPLKQIWGYASLIYAFVGMALIAAIDILRLLAGQDLLDHDPSHASLS